MNDSEIDKIKEQILQELDLSDVKIDVDYETVPSITRVVKREYDESNYGDFVSKNKDILKRELPKIIDHTRLNSDAVAGDVERLCDEALRYRFCSVCVNSSYIKMVKNRLDGSGVKVSATVGFPLGASNTDAKVAEAEKAIKDGADELDVVINIGKLKDKEYKYIYREIKNIVNIRSDITVKVIIETCYLNEEEKIAASYIVKLAGAHFVKTSTGFGSYGAKEEDIRLIRRVVGEEMGIKAAGGIRDIKSLLNMVRAGATRIGTSSSVLILGEL